jgi:flagellar protein FliL
MAEAGQDDSPQESAPATAPKARRGKGKLLLLASLGCVLLLGGAGAAAYVFVPQVSQTVQSLVGKKPAPTASATGPSFIDLPEMAVTLPNGGHARQMRIRLSIELAKGAAADTPSSQILSPRVYEALLIYLRTLRDGELDNGLAIDRLRADLYRRMTLLLGPGVVGDVLITSLVLA